MNTSFLTVIFFFNCVLFLVLIFLNKIFFGFWLSFLELNIHSHKILQVIFHQLKICLLDSLNYSFDPNQLRRIRKFNSSIYLNLSIIFIQSQELELLIDLFHVKIYICPHIYNCFKRKRINIYFSHHQFGFSIQYFHNSNLSCLNVKISNLSL